MTFMEALPIIVWAIAPVLLVCVVSREVRMYRRDIRNRRIDR